MPTVARWSFLALLACLAFPSSCCLTGDGGEGGAIDVDYVGPHTVTASNSTAAADLVGPKRVGVEITASQPLRVMNVVLSHWPAGNNAGSQSLEQTLDQDLAAGARTIVWFDIPGSEHFGICDGLYYMFAVGYSVTGGSNGLFLGEPQLILPTKRYLSNGTLEQALCVEPPGPGE